MTGANAVVRSLENLGVKYTFGMPGLHNLELFDSLSGSTIKNILVTNESFAAFMADGYARSTGKVGVCLTIPGPGLTNMVTGLAEAYLDSSAVVVLVTGFAKSDNVFHTHQIKQLEVVRPVVKAVIKLDDIKEIPVQLYRAFQLAQQEEPGPVVVEIDADLLKKQLEFQENHIAKNEEERPGNNKDKIRQITEMLIHADFCGIYAGGGALSAACQIKQLAEALSMPVATTVSGRGVIPEDHELAVGFGFGPSGSKLAEDIFKKCDTILALGCKFSETSTGSWGMDMPDNLIHIDSNQEVFNKNYPAKITLCQDVKTALEEILDLIDNVKKPKNTELIEKIRRDKEKYLNDAEKIKHPGVISAARFFAQLRKGLRKDTILVTDCGNHQLCAISDFAVFKPRTFITPADYQAMGFAIPAAIGAKIGCPEKKVVCVCGDGGFLISGFEILTAVRENLDLTVIVFNDGTLGFIKNLQEAFYDRSTSTDFVAPDYRSLADSLGIDYHKIESNGELTSDLKKILSKKKVALVDVKVEYEQLPRYIEGVSKTMWKRFSWKKKAVLIIERLMKTH